MLKSVENIRRLMQELEGEDLKRAASTCERYIYDPSRKALEKDKNDKHIGKGEQRVEKT